MVGKNREGGQMMKVILYAITCAMFGFCGRAMAQYGPCAASIQSVPIYCQDTNGCHGSATINYPVGIGGYGLEAYNFTCCGAINSTYYWVAQCWYTRVNDPDMHQRLLDLSQRGDFLIATCKGAYLPLSVALEEKPLALKPQKIL